MTVFAKDVDGIAVVKKFSQHVDGKTIVITEASAGGLGAAAAVCLAYANPSQILLLARSASEVAPVVAEVAQLDCGIKTTFVAIELDKLDSVRKAAAIINARVEKIDLLFNNPGALAMRHDRISAANLESHLATNRLGQFLLTNLLMSKVLAAGRGARIINLASGGYVISKVHDPRSSRGPSRTADILFTRELSSRLRSRGIQSFTVQPRVIWDASPLSGFEPSVFIGTVNVADKGSLFSSDFVNFQQQGVSTTLIAALDPALASQQGSYTEGCADARKYFNSAENAKKLWELSEELVAQEFDF